MMPLELINPSEYRSDRRKKKQTKTKHTSFPLLRMEHSLYLTVPQ